VEEAWELGICEENFVTGSGDTLSGSKLFVCHLILFLLASFIYSYTMKYSLTPLYWECIIPLTEFNFGES
jgi:hypothetical protein